MKLEKTKKEKEIQIMFDQGISPNKIFQEIRWACLDQASITEKEVWSTYFLSWVTAWIWEKSKIKWIRLWFYFRVNNSKQHIKMMRDKIKIETVFQYWDFKKNY